jgi:hypothetical protein
MRNQMLYRAIATALLLAFGLATGTARAESPQFNWLRISVFTDNPLAGADVAVFATDGQLLFEKANATNVRGIYPVKLMPVPKDFRVVVVGVNPNPSHRFNLGLVVLSADVHNYNPITDVVYVNPVTTMVTGVKLRHPEFSLQQAQARVRQFLGMPANASLGAALRETPLFQSAYFSESAFLNQANEHGGMLYFIADLLNQMLGNPRAIHRFPSLLAPSQLPAIEPHQSQGINQTSISQLSPSASLGSSSGDVATFVATNLAAGALEWVEGQGLGWVAQSAGIIAPGATAAQVAQLQQSLDSLQSSVSQLKDQLQQSTQQILNELTKTQYNTLATQALALASDVNVAEQNLDYYVDGCPPLPEDGTSESDGSLSDDWCRTQGDLVRSQLTDIQINGSYERLAGWLLDNPSIGFKGMIHLFSLSAGQSVRFFRPADSTRVQNMFNYWQTVETQAANLKVELWHLNGNQNNSGGKKQITDFLGNPDLDPPTTGTFQATNAAEQQLMFPPLPVGTVLDTKTLLMWLTDLPRFNVVFLNGKTNYFCPYLQGTDTPGYGYTSGPSFGYSYNGLSWISPNLSQMQALISGWSGSSPMAWLISQSQAVAPDTPTSSGFFNVIACGQSGNNVYVWTTNNQGSQGTPYSPYALMDMRNGSVPPKNTPPYVNITNLGQYLYLARGLAKGEQYYWYQ